MNPGTKAFWTKGARFGQEHVFAFPLDKGHVFSGEAPVTGLSQAEEESWFVAQRIELWLTSTKQQFKKIIMNTKVKIAQVEKITGEEVLTSAKFMHQLEGVFADGKAFKEIDQKQPVYEIQAYMPVEEGKEGGLFFGNSMIYPGKVGNEYFMTRGHFHANKDTAEYYWCIKGEGALIMMDMDRNCWFEKMEPGSLHYIPGNVAHRVANTGDDVLFFNACWPSNAGHDYESIDKEGFSARLLEINNNPKLVTSK